MACVLNMIGLVNGMKTVIMDGKFEIDRFIEDITRHRISAALLVPTLMGRLLNKCGDKITKLASLRLVMYGSSPATASLLKQFREHVCCSLMQTYGTTEGGWVSHLTPSDHDLALNGRPELLRSAGRIGGMYELSIRDDKGNRLNEGKKGEIWLYGPTTMLRYQNLPDKTNETLKGEWLRTNDIGYFDEDGFLYLAGRKKFMIVTGAVNVLPESVESVLSEHPGICDIAVVGAPHPEWGEAVIAVVVPKTGQPVPSVEDLGDFARSNLSRMELPKHVFTTAELPRTTTSKVDKNAVREWVHTQWNKLPWADDKHHVSTGPHKE
jgi:acyl-CoA synthetase (AMP-forming)/AMP-acid ligase II